MKTRIYLFLTALLQVMLVSMNIVFITYHQLLAMTITGFAISIIWTFNVKKVAFGSLTDRIIYGLRGCGWDFNWILYIKVINVILNLAPQNILLIFI
jgi:hypothetical protein